MFYLMGMCHVFSLNVLEFIAMGVIKCDDYSWANSGASLMHPCRHLSGPDARLPASEMVVWNLRSGVGEADQPIFKSLPQCYM
jgi:hypothetical protein